MNSQARRHHALRTALLLTGIIISAGCADAVTAPQLPEASSPVIALPAVETTTCRYGGDYPFCRPAPSPDGMGVNPGTEPVDGGGSSEPTPPPDADKAFGQGPLAWGACILAVAGSTLTIYDVLDKFQAWHSAYLDAKGAYDLWQATVQNSADPVIQQLYEYQYKQARQRQEDAKSSVSSATNTSYAALAGFALACGAFALAPTP